MGNSKIEVPLSILKRKNSHIYIYFILQNEAILQHSFIGENISNV
jgi:hypothetical protein